MKVYLIGGAVRDKLMGTPCDDFDYVVVLPNLNTTVEEGFKLMENHLQQEGYEIFLSTPEMFTIRAKFPKIHKNSKLVADFVLARKEIGYEKKSRRPILELGTLKDDMERRDFTVNAMAEDEDGNIIDLFDGQYHLKQKILFTPIDSNKSMMDDPLRLIRALRFAITKGFNIDSCILECFENKDIIEKLTNVVSIERIQSEINKCFKYDTHSTLHMLNFIKENHCYNIYNIIFPKNYYLNLTNKK